MSQENLDLNSHHYGTKRNYNQMMENSIDKTVNNDSFIKNQLFKSTLIITNQDPVIHHVRNELFKSTIIFGGPISQDLVIHHKKNVEKSTKNEVTNTNIEKKEINKNEVKFDLCNSSKDKINISEHKTDIFNGVVCDNNSDSNINNNHFQFGNCYGNRKVDNNGGKCSVFDIEKRVVNDGESKIKATNSNPNDNCGNVGVIYNPFLEKNNTPNKNEPVNPFHSSRNLFFINNNGGVNDVVENPFLAITKPKIENPFKIKNPNNNKILNPFLDNPNCNAVNDPFVKNTVNISNSVNPFISSNTAPNNAGNPFISLLKRLGNFLGL